MSQKRTRPIRLCFRVTEHEQDLIIKKMAQAGIRNKEAYLRKVAIDGFVIKLELSDMKEFIRLLGTVSNNINQIAKRANETRNIYESDVLNLPKMYDALWEQANGILRELAEIRTK